MGAYLDRMVVYQGRRVTEESSYSRSDTLDSMRLFQRIRQAADLHLLRVLQAVRDLKRPPVNVVIRQVEQVNVAGQQQVNVDRGDPPSK